MMQKVIIISTEHQESGKCNSDELLKIIESIKPEVIFEEEPNDDKYHSFYSEQNTFKSLEIKTIIKYKKNYKTVNIPIDKPINEFASLYLLDKFTKYFRQFQVYKILIREHCTLREKDGFAYLNSKKCSELNEKKFLLEKQIISESGSISNELNILYNQFHQEIDARESKMIENIFEFAKSNNFEKAVFLLGYAHRESFRKRINERRILDSKLITWTFFNE